MEDEFTVERAPTEPSSSEFSHQPCLCHSLPIEVRRNIYRNIAVSRLDCLSHPRLWRPLGVDGDIYRIGYFDRDTVIPLLLTGHSIHDEAAAILYGENTFAFHISGLTEGPIRFLEWLAPRYIRLLRKVYITTGYHVDLNGFSSNFLHTQQPFMKSTVEAAQIKAIRDLAISVALMKQAWPEKYRVIINKRSTVAYAADEVANLLNNYNADNCPASSYHLWKMFMTDLAAPLPRMEFKRIEWGGPTVKNMKPDGTRTTMP